MPDLPHLDWPIRMGPDGQIVTVEQDSDREIAVAMAMVISWPLGQMPTDPEFGTPEQAFRGAGPDLDMIRAALAVNEPRALTQITQDDRALSQFSASVRVAFDQTHGGS